MLYFAYGSNMNEDELGKINIKIINAEKAILNDYVVALTRESKNRDGGVLDIVSSKGGIVEGVLFKIPDEYIKKINEKEGVCVGAYEPIIIKAQTMKGKQVSNVISYQVCKKDNPPQASKEYKESVLKGANDHGLSAKYIIELQKVLEKDERI